MKELHEKGPAIHSAPSLALLPQGTQRSIDRGIGGVGIELRKIPIGAPTTCPRAEGKNARGDSARPRTSPRKLRPPTPPANSPHRTAGTPGPPTTAPHTPMR